MTIQEIHNEYRSLREQISTLEIKFDRDKRWLQEKQRKLIDDYVAENRKFKDGDIVCLAESESANPRKYRITIACGVEYLQEPHPNIDIRYGTESLNGGKGMYGGYHIPEYMIKLAE